MAREPMYLPIPPGATFRPCRACRKPITFVRTQSGQMMPVDRPESHYNSREGGVGQSHYQTCSDPARFSRKGKS